MRYASMGRLPAKRHTQFRENGTLLTEEVMGYEGFSGNESILYHLHSPCRVAEVGDFEPIELEEWVPDAHVHRLTDTVPLEPEGDTVFGRKVLMFNADVEMGICKPVAEAECFYRNGEGDEVLFIHEGSGELETVFGRVPFRTARLRRDPARHDLPRRARRGPAHVAHLPHAGRDRDARTATATATGSCSRTRRSRSATSTRRSSSRRTPDRGDFELVVRVRSGYQHFTLDYHPFDVVGWDGYVYPYTFNIHDFEPKSGRIHQPPPVHQTFQGPNFVICSFCPRELDWDPEAVPIPYVHSNLQSEEVIYYVDGQFGSRKGVGVGAITLHPSGLPHGPQPGVVEKMLGKRHTDELAVMCDTFKPLKLTHLAPQLDDPSYALSWHTPLQKAEA